jgi:uncharacterized membrane protein YfcA
MAALENPDSRLLPASGWSGLRLAAVSLRTVFILTLLVLAVRVSLPQSETIWSAYETPDDLIRMLLGLLLCIWFLVLLFRGPRDARGLRTWLYIGLFAEPFVLICLYAVW